MSEEQFAPIFRGTNTGLNNAFEYWLQGRVNLCITGLQDQITRLEIQNNELRKQLSETTSTNDDAVRGICSDYWEGWLNNNNLTDYIESRHIWSLIEYDVNTAIEEADVDLDDDALEAKIKDVVNNLSFEVVVS